MDAAEEARLVDLARRGDMCAFGALIDANQGAVRAFLRRLVGNAADADDLAQEAFARTWEVLHRFDGASRLRTFICGVAFQYWRRQRRGRLRREAREQAYAQLAEAATSGDARSAARVALRKAMEVLPEDQRAVLALCLGQDFTHAEAAVALGLPLGTVKSHVQRGRRAVAGRARPHYGVHAMNSDLELAKLLGEAPEGPDPGFRFDVFARMAARAKRREAVRRALGYAAALTALGLSFPAANAVGLGSTQLQPMLLVAGAFALAYVLAVAATHGPRAALARSRVLLRAHP